MAAGQHLLISSEVFHRHCIRGLTVGSVVDERAHRNPLDKLRYTTDVVIVEVSDQQVVDLADAGELRRG